MNSKNKSYSCSMNDEGKITIPKHIREKLNISPYEYLEIIPSDEGLFIKFVERVEGRTERVLSKDEKIKKLEKIEHQRNMQVQNGISPIKTKRYQTKKTTTKCTLCGCLNGLKIVDGAAYCDTCLDRKKYYEAKFNKVKLGGC